MRDRLLDRVGQRWVSPITVVTAPAGYGKTTLLTQAIAANAAAPLGIDCWLTCGPGMATASSFGAALCAAVGVQGTPSDPASSVVDALWRRSPQQVALSIDDIHVITPGSEAANLLAAIVAALPANGHLVLAGRTPPPLPLARLDVAGRIVRIDEAELTFTDDELAEFAALRNVRQHLLADSGGWPALAELSASVQSVSTAEYVGQEVLSHVPEDRRRELALLAHAGPFDDELASAVLGRDVAAEELVAGLPLVQRLPGGEMSLHSLWQSLLSGDAAADAIAEGRRRSGLVWLERGRVSDAMELLLDAEAWDDVARAVTIALGAVHPPVARDVLEDWYERLPRALRAGPSGRLLSAVVGVEGDLGGAWQDFEECAEAFSAIGDTTGELACTVQLGQVAWWSDNPERLAAAAGRAFALEAAGCEDATPFACLGRALIYDIADDSEQMLAELDRIPGGSLSDPWLGIVNWARAIGHLQLGYTAAAQDAAERALTYAGSLHAPLAQGTRLQALWYQGRLAEVREALPQLLEQVTASGYRNSTVLIAAQCAAAYAFDGQPERAAGYLEQARATATLVPDAPLVDTNIAVADAVLAIANDDEVGAAASLTAYVQRHPIGTGLPVAAQRRHIALLYVLVPETREVWDKAELGPAWLVGRELARAVVHVREHGRLPRDLGPLDDSAVVRAHLPPSWAAELGVAAIAAKRADGWPLLDASSVVTRTVVARLATSGRGSMRRAARDVVARLPVPPAAHLTLRLLGPVELVSGDVLVTEADWRRERVRSLLSYLVLHGTVSRQQAADDLWPALDPEAQSRNLRVTLTYLLRVLEPDRAPRAASYFIRQHGGNISLHAGDRLAADVWEFDALCAAATDADREGTPSEALDLALRAVELWRGDPVELLSDEWAITPIEQRRRRFCAVATRAGELLLAKRNFDESHALAEQVLALDPWMEAAHRLVIASHRTAGNDLAARRALQRYRAAVHEIGVSPDEATQIVERLVERLLAAGSP